MKPIVCKYRVSQECESTSYDLRANKLQIYPIASCEAMNQQVVKLGVCNAAS